VGDLFDVATWHTRTVSAGTHVKVVRATRCSYNRVLCAFGITQMHKPLRYTSAEAFGYFDRRFPSRHAFIMHAACTCRFVFASDSLARGSGELRSATNAFQQHVTSTGQNG
jgi:hypothetical protein